MSYKKITDHSLNATNPFMKDVISEIKKGDKHLMFGYRGADMIVDKDGDVKGNGVMIRRQTVDQDTFVKVFVRKVSYMMDLSTCGIRVFGYILNELSPNQDQFYMDYDKCMEFTKYGSRKTISNGLGELLESKLIARGKNTFHFYVNIGSFFNGDRLTFIDQYIKKNNEETAVTNSIESKLLMPNNDGAGNKEVWHKSMPINTSINISIDDINEIAKG